MLVICIAPSLGRSIEICERLGAVAHHEEFPLSGDPVVVCQLPQEPAVDLVHGPTGHILQGQLLGIECEVHGPPRGRHGWMTARA